MNVWLLLGGTTPNRPVQERVSRPLPGTACSKGTYAPGHTYTAGIVLRIEVHQAPSRSLRLSRAHPAHTSYQPGLLSGAVESQFFC